MVERHKRLLGKIKRPNQKLIKNNIMNKEEIQEIINQLGAIITKLKEAAEKTEEKPAV